MPKSHVRPSPTRLLACLLLLQPVAVSHSAAADASASSVDYAREIRPILTSKCFRCHGPDEETIEAGLRLDARSQAIAELDSGIRAIVPGDPEASELIVRVSEPDDDYRMPPADAGERLTADEVELLRRWISEGAAYAEHWAFVPPGRPAIPRDLPLPTWVRNPVDRFVLERLEREGLRPNEAAERAILIRRVSLDLTGLPPTIEDVDRFVTDCRPDAYERLVDRLLASPAYGERWARVWLDLARYADSAGYAQDPARTIWRYRDWVIRALNANLPFDQFTIEQLAGDMLADPTEDQLIATAFHRNTMTNSEGGTDDEEFRNAAVIDRVNTTMQVWMGLTMGCAQCHSHKYDPISQEDYYRFFAILNNTQDADRGDESPTLVTFTAEETTRQAELRKQIAELEQAMAEPSALPAAESANDKGPLTPRYLRVELPGQGVLLSLAEVQAFVGEQNVAEGRPATQSSTDYDGPADLAVDGNPDGDFFQAKSTTHTAKGDDPWWEVDLGEPLPVQRIVVWNRTDGNTGGRLKGFRIVALDPQRSPLWVKPIAAAPDPNVEVALPPNHAALSAAELVSRQQYRDQATTPGTPAQQQQLEKLRKQLAAIKGVPTPILRELPPDKRRKTYIQIRGDFRSPGPQVEPGVPAAFHPLPEGVEPDRLALAKWLVDPENPLTARVVVNRYWEELFGVGLVETSEDFGLQGEPPSHPELLDYLATELMQNGWDTKRLVRLLVTSATYRQSSQTSDELADRDPQNRLLARGPRFRLSAEMLRDQALFAGGLLSRKLYGPSVRPPQPKMGLKAAFGGSTDWTTSSGEDRYRRGLYTSWRRTTPYPSMITFDAPSREVCTIRRIRTNTPLQALVTLNDPVFVESAQGLARQIVELDGVDLEDRVVYAFRRCLARHPSAWESGRLCEVFRRARDRYQAAPDAAREMATDPLGPAPEAADLAELAAWTLVTNVLMNLDEFLAKR